LGGDSETKSLAQGYLAFAFSFGVPTRRLNSAAFYCVSLSLDQYHYR
jgi:hypothetical protein